MAKKTLFEIEPGTAKLIAELLAHSLNRRPQGFRPDVSVAEYAARVETAMEALEHLSDGRTATVVLAKVTEGA